MRAEITEVSTAAGKADGAAVVTTRRLSTHQLPEAPDDGFTDLAVKGCKGGPAQDDLPSAVEAPSRQQKGSGEAWGPRAEWGRSGR